MATTVDWSAFDDLDRSRPGMVAAVVAGGAVEHWASFGSESAGGPALTDRSPFYVASVAKQFTAAAIGMLVLDGAITLDEPARRWLPELGPSWSRVRVHHLVDHTAGLLDSNALDAKAGFTVGSTFSTARRAAVIMSADVAHEPGSVHRYSNHGYVLLAEIVERASGVRLGELARDRIFEPLGMRSSGFLDAARIGPVQGWAGGIEPVTIRFSCVGDGGLVTTISDLARWDGWLPTSPLAPLMLDGRPTVASGRVAHDAWGISLRTHHGQPIQSHGGAIDGFLTTFVRFPALGRSVVVMANTDEHGVEGIGRRARAFADSLFGPHLDPSKPPWTETHGAQE